jgi:hypothetical protein
MNSSLLLAAAIGLLATVAQAQQAASSADQRAIGTAVQRDARGNQSVTAAASLPVGRNTWVQAGVGRSRSRDSVSRTTYQPTQLSVGGGVAGGQWQATVSASRRRDDNRLRQTDWTAAVDWRPAERVSVGVDVVRRDARARGVVTTAAGGAPTVVEQRLTGHGVGVHGAVAVTQGFSLYGATMRNRYRSSSQQSTPGSSDGLLGGALLGRSRVSIVNRDEAAFERSHQLGATWRVGERVVLNGEYTQDRVLEGGQLRSLQLKAAIAAGDSGWTFTPGIGRSRSSQGESVNHGSLAARFAW